jgi:transposase InsO family protein
MPWKEMNSMNQRLEFAMRSLRTGNFSELCAEYGISPKTGYKWQRRLLEHGVAGLGEASRRPKRSPEALEESVVCRMVALKVAHRAWGPRKIRAVYRRLHGAAPSESSFKRVLERAGLTQRRRVRRVVAPTQRLHSGQRGEEPNGVWTVDFKGWWKTAGRRCEPLTVRDECSRFVLAVQAMESTAGEPVRRCFQGLFERYGLPRAIRSDNGVPFAQSQALLGLTRLSAWWVALGIELERGRPGCPQDNGAHERMHRDLAWEIEATGAAQDQAALEVWRTEYNEQRPHEALGMRTPAEVYQPSPRRFQGTPQQLLYPGMLPRRIGRQGDLKWENHRIFITTALAGWDVGLKPTGEGTLEVWFGHLLLGWLDPRTASFQRGARPPLEAVQPPQPVQP